MPTQRQILKQLAEYQASGTVVFNNSKQATVPYGKTFKGVPIVNFTNNDASSFPAYKQSTTNTSFTIKLQSVWTGTVDWIANERL